MGDWSQLGWKAMTRQHWPQPFQSARLKTPFFDHDGGLNSLLGSSRTDAYDYTDNVLRLASKNMLRYTDAELAELTEKVEAAKKLAAEVKLAKHSEKTKKDDS